MCNHKYNWDYYGGYDKVMTAINIILPQLLAMKPRLKEQLMRDLLQREQVASHRLIDEEFVMFKILVKLNRGIVNGDIEVLRLVAIIECLDPWLIGQLYEDVLLGRNFRNKVQYQHQRLCTDEVELKDIQLAVRFRY